MPRYKDKQQSPANFRDTKLSDPDSRSAEATQQGVVNTHAYGELQGKSYADIGEGVAKGIGHAKEFKDGYDLAKIAQEQNELNERFLNGATADDIAKQESEEQIAIETEEKMWDVLSSDQAVGKGEEVVGAINVATKNAKDAQAALGRMKAQGKIGPDEFVARSTLLTKQQIARFPSLTDEILEQTQKQWKISNISSRVSMEQESKKAVLAEEKREKVRIETNWLKDPNHAELLYKKNGEVDYDTMTEIGIARTLELGDIQKGAKIIASATQTSELKLIELKRINPANGKSTLASNRKSARLKMYQGTKTFVDMVTANPSVDGRREATYLFRSFIANERRAIRAYFSPLKPSKEAESLEKDALDDLKLYEDKYVNDFSAKDGADIGTNLNTIINNTEKQEVYEATGSTLESKKVQAQLLSFVPKKLIMEDLDLQKELHKQAKQMSDYLLDALKNANNNNKPSDKSEERTFLKMLYDPKNNLALMKASNRAREADPDNEHNAAHERNFNGHIQLQIANIGVDDSEAGTRTSYDNFITALSDKEIRSAGEILTEKTKNKSQGVLDNASGYYDNAIKTTMNRLKGVGVKIKATMVNGSLRFSEVGGTGNNTHEVNELHTNVSARITKVRASLAMIHGLVPTDVKVTEMLLNKMPFLKNMLEPEVEKNKGK